MGMKDSITDKWVALADSPLPKPTFEEGAPSFLILGAPGPTREPIVFRPVGEHKPSGYGEPGSPARWIASGGKEPSYYSTYTHWKYYVPPMSR